MEEPCLTPSEERVLQIDGPATAGDVQLAMKLRVGAASEGRVARARMVEVPMSEWLKPRIEAL